MKYLQDVKPPNIYPKFVFCEIILKCVEIVGFSADVMVITKSL